MKHDNAPRETDRLADQLRRAIEGEAWHGPSLLEVLEDVSAEQAAARPIPDAHGIWEIVLHLKGTYDLVLRRLESDGRQLTPAEDWPEVPAVSEERWRADVEALRASDRELREAIRAFAVSRLDERLVPDPPYSAYTQFSGMTQHVLYHAGQIAILKRALGRARPPA